MNKQINTNQQTNTLPPVAHLDVTHVFTHNINTTLEKGDCVANSLVMSAVHRALELRAQIKLANEQLERDKDLIVEFMGKNTRLLDESGLPIATYKRNSPSEIVNKKTLQDTYPEVYNMVVDLKEGAMVLRFE